MARAHRTAPRLRRAIQRHYDSLDFLYRAFWGSHIHHGLWMDGPSPAPVAQERLVSYLADRAAIRGGEHVIDVGCGYGASGRWLAHHRGCRVTGLTISRRQAREARRLNRAGGDSASLRLIRADAADLPITHSTFDVVWVIECIEHLTDKRRFIHEVARILSPGGRLALCTWQRGDGTPPDDALAREVCEAFLCPSLATATEYRNWSVEAGLAVVHQEDLTTRVQATWDILIQRVHRPWLAPLRLLLGSDIRRFVDGFPAIASAYASGSMSYGLLVAARPA